MEVTTKTVQTIHGDVEVQLTECDSCGNEVRVEETVPFQLGSREGVACKEYCVENGPLNFPSKRLRDYYDGFGGEDSSFLWILVWTPIIIPITMVMGPVDSDAPKEVNVYSATCWCIFIWTLLVFGFWVMFL